MKYEEAIGIVKEYQARASLTPDEEFLLLEAWSFLIEAEGESPDADIYIYNLANYYYRHGDFGLAKKYYEKAYDHGNVLAAQSLGDIWYQGLTGETDYEKAFRYYSVAATNGFPRSMIKLADMYRDGLFVNEDYEEYCRRIRKIYNRIWDSPVPNEKGAVFFRLAEIVLEDDEFDQAVELLFDAEEQLDLQMRRFLNPEDLELMQSIKELQADLLGPYPDGLNIYDLFTVLREETIVRFRSPAGIHNVSSQWDNGEMTIHFDGSWYHSLSDFFRRAEISGRKLPEIAFELKDFKILS